MPCGCSSSVGKKVVIALTGLILSLFVLVHMAGNLLLFVGPEAYNTYSHALISNPFIVPIELGLLLAFVVHVALAVRLTIENRALRPVPYLRPPSGEKLSSFASRTMIYQGSILLVFTIFHLITFKYGPYYEVSYQGVVMRDIYRLVAEVFTSPAYLMGYVLSMIVLGIHLSHGVSSVFKSWGFSHPRWTKWLEKFGMVYAVVVAVGFLSQPIFMFWLAYARN